MSDTGTKPCSKGKELAHIIFIHSFDVPDPWIGVYLQLTLAFPKQVLDGREIFPVDADMLVKLCSIAHRQ
jgi:hypothetical protein